MNRCLCAGAFAVTLVLGTSIALAQNSLPCPGSGCPEASKNPRPEKGNPDKTQVPPDRSSKTESQTEKAAKAAKSDRPSKYESVTEKALKAAKKDERREAKSIDEMTTNADGKRIAKEAQPAKGAEAVKDAGKSMSIKK